MRAMAVEEFSSSCRHGNAGPEALVMVLLDEAAFIGIFPYRKTGARGAPCVHDFCIRPRLRADPFEKVEYQSVYGVGQNGLHHARNHLLAPHSGSLGLTQPG